MSDYSEHLIAARKALANAEAWAALHDWTHARECADRAEYCCNDLKKALDWQSGTRAK